MVEKKDVVDNWPIETGDYVVGEKTSPVAVVTLGSHIAQEVVDSGAAVAGPLHTENLGIEKVVANTVSNSNIRFVILCGSEVQGHITGATMVALYENGIDSEKKNILGSPGAIPFVENLEEDAITRFQNQVELIDLINQEDLNVISQKITECINNDPGAYSEDAMIINIHDKKEEEADQTDTNKTPLTQTGSVDTLSIELLNIQNRIKSMQSEINEIASMEKFSSGYYAGKIEGMVLGFIFTMIILMIGFYYLIDFFEGLL